MLKILSWVNIVDSGYLEFRDWYRCEDSKWMKLDKDQGVEDGRYSTRVILTL